MTIQEDNMDTPEETNVSKHTLTIYFAAKTSAELQTQICKNLMGTVPGTKEVSLSDPYQQLAPQTDEKPVSVIFRINSPHETITPAQKNSIGHNIPRTVLAYTFDQDSLN